VKPSGPAFCMLKDFLIIVLAIDLFIFSISSRFSLGRLYFSKIFVGFLQVVHFVGV